MEMEMEVGLENQYEQMALDKKFTEYHYRKNAEQMLSIKRLSRLPVSFEDARRIANKQQEIR